jgi:hypothetical protein
MADDEEPVVQGPPHSAAADLCENQPAFRIEFERSVAGDLDANDVGYGSTVESGDRFASAVDAVIDAVIFEVANADSCENVPRAYDRHDG